MVTQRQAKDYYLEMYRIGTIYVWGFNSGTTIDEISIKKAYKEYGSKRYDWTYYSDKLKEGEGKNGSDCSGLHYPLSGHDMTAQSYYDKAPVKGTMDNLPKDKVVLLFRGDSTKSIVHTGAYLGNGMVVHAKNSKENTVYESVDRHPWKYWAMPDWINYEHPDYKKYTYNDFINDVMTILGVKTVQRAFGLAPTISTTVNRKHPLVTPLERYMTALGYYTGTIEADEQKTPVYGNGMKKAVIQYQREIVKNSEKNCDGIITKGQRTWRTLLFNGE